MDSIITRTIETKNNALSGLPIRERDNNSKTSLVEIRDLKVVYNLGKPNENEALRGVSLEIYPEEYVIFFGPSGCGKSTLVNVIAGLEIPTAGEANVGGRSLHKLSSNEMAMFHRKEIGMIAQAYNLISTLTVLGNVILPQIFERTSRRERRKRGEELLLKFGLEKLGKRLPTELSGGQQQRVGIARALVNNPSIILADEAVGNLDSESAENVLEILNRLNVDDKKTIISVTHNPEHLFYADRIFHMRDGQIIKVEVNTEKIKKQKAKEGLPADDKRKKTAIELLIEAYPNLSGMDLNTMIVPFKAKMLAEYLINRFEDWEVGILERKIADRLLGRLDQSGLTETLDVSLEEGGLNLNIDLARHYSKVVENIFGEAVRIKNDRTRLEEKNSPEASTSIERIRKTLLGEYVKELDAEKIVALDAGIQLRLENKLGRKELQSYLDRPRNEGGVGLNSKTAKKITQKLELILLLEFGT
ncbi:MAG: ABC transporter ATP-binding protein [Candidatus Moraniibacteriota bacterium]